MRGKGVGVGPVIQVPGITPARAGKSYQYDNLTRELGITPARAGKRSGQVTLPDDEEDHPRACGEKGPEERRTA